MSFDQLRKLLRCEAHQVEDVLRDERSAKAALSRRGLFVGMGAVAGGLVLVEAHRVVVDDYCPSAGGFTMRHSTGLPRTIDGIVAVPGQVYWVIGAAAVKANGPWIATVSGWSRPSLADEIVFAKGAT